MAKVIMGWITAVFTFLLLITTGCSDMETLADDDYPICTATSVDVVLIVTTPNGDPVDCAGLGAFIRTGGAGYDCSWTGSALWTGCNDGTLYGTVNIANESATYFGITLFVNEQYVTHTTMSYVVESFTDEVVIETHVTYGNELYWNDVMTR